MCIQWLFFFVWEARKVTNVCPYKPYFVGGLYIFSESCSVLLFVARAFFNCFLTLQCQSRTSDVQHIDMLIDFLGFEFFIKNTVVNDMVYRMQQFDGSTLASCVGGSRLILGSECSWCRWAVKLTELLNMHLSASSFYVPLLWLSHSFHHFIHTPPVMFFTLGER
jgi:hypothetical protein